MTWLESPRCALGHRSCHCAADGAHWRVEWRVGAAEKQFLIVDGDRTECEVLSLAPAAPLARSYKRLVEILPDGRERTWLHAGDRDLARERLRLLERVLSALTSANGSAAYEGSLWSALARDDVARSSRAGAPGLFVVHLCELASLLASDPAECTVAPEAASGSALRWRVAGLARRDALEAARSWQRDLNGEDLACGFSILATELSALGGPRRYVQMFSSFRPVLALAVTKQDQAGGPL